MINDPMDLRMISKGSGAKMQDGGKNHHRWNFVVGSISPSMILEFIRELGPYSFNFDRGCTINLDYYAHHTH